MSHTHAPAITTRNLSLNEIPSPADVMDTHVQPGDLLVEVDGKPAGYLLLTGNVYAIDMHGRLVGHGHDVHEVLPAFDGRPPADPKHTMQVEIRTVYGKDLVYPANDIARRFSDLTGKVTFARWDIDTIRALGFTVAVSGYDHLPWEA